MKVCSFLPAATSIIYELGLEQKLHGVTFECPSDKPKVVRSHLEGNTYSSREIDEQVKEYMQRNENLYYVDDPLLTSIAPDLIFTQHLCNVCQIGTSYVEEVTAHLDKQPNIVALVPHRLSEVYENIATIAELLQAEEAGEKLLHSLKQRTESIALTLRQHDRKPKKVMFMEWIDPIYHCGHWIADQVEAAGGNDMLAKAGMHSGGITWEQLRVYDPEILVIGPCGFPVEKGMQEVDVLTTKPGWEQLQAVRNNQVYVVDADLFTCPSAALVDGIELLASIFHPDLFPVKASQQHLLQTYHPTKS